MGQLQLITSNPVTDEYNAAQKRAADQATADLTNAINQQAYEQNAQLFPSKLRQVTRAADQADLSYDTDLKEQPDTLMKNHNDALNSGVTLQKSQEDFRHSRVVNPLLERSDAANAANDELTLSTNRQEQPYAVARARSDADNAALGVTKSQLDIDKAQTDRQNNDQDRAIKLLGDGPEAHENLTVLAARDSEQAIKLGKAAGIITNPEQEAILRRPDIVGQANVVISVLRSIAPSDASWRDSEFNQLMAEAVKDPSLLSFSNRQRLRERVQQDFNGGNSDKRTDLARMRASQLLRNSPQFQMATPADQQKQMDTWANYFLNGGTEPPLGSDLSNPPAPSSTPPSSGTDSGWHWYDPSTWGSGSSSSTPAASPSATVLPLPRTSDGRLDRTQLKAGNRYDMPNVGTVQFNGTNFEAVQ